MSTMYIFQQSSLSKGMEIGSLWSGRRGACEFTLNIIWQSKLPGVIKSRFRTNANRFLDPAAGSKFVNQRAIQRTVTDSKLPLHTLVDTVATPRFTLNVRKIILRLCYEFDKNSKAKKYTALWYGQRRRFWYSNFAGKSCILVWRTPLS